MEPMKNQLWTDKPRNFLGLAINFTRYIITSEKFITRKGFLNIHEDEIMLYRITDKKLALPITPVSYTHLDVYKRQRNT